MKVTDDVLAVLDRARVIGNELRIDEQLDRPMYVQVNKVLEAAGGKWNRKAKAHVFGDDPSSAINDIALAGEVTTRQETGFFPTPSHVADIVIGEAALVPGLRVLEPSAGNGALAERALDAGCHVTCYEIDPKLAVQNIPMNVADFLTVAPDPSYDRVLMNPPFARQQDIDHVRHAYEFLRPGGRLVSVMSAGVMFRENRKSVEFRMMVDAHYGFIAPLPDGSFHDVGTDVRTCLVVIPR